MMSDQKNPDDETSRRAFTVASRDVAAPFDLTLQSVESAIRSFPRANIMRADRDIGVVIIQVPANQIDQVREALGDAFMIDPNAQLKL
jgi:hypothetical protein